MKSIKLEVFAGNKQFTSEIKLHNFTGANKAIGSSINRLFEYNTLLRKHGSDFIKENDLVSIVISSEGAILLDSYELNERFNFKLKFGNTARSKRKFATMLHDLMLFAASGVKTLTIEELIEQFKVEELVNS